MKRGFRLYDFAHWCLWAWITVGWCVIVPVAVWMVTP